VEELEVSEPCLEQAGRQTDFTVEGGPDEPSFDARAIRFPWRSNRLSERADRMGHSA
jgi:hypothetical protein